MSNFYFHFSILNAHLNWFKDWTKMEKIVKFRIWWIDFLTTTKSYYNFLFIEKRWKPFFIFTILHVNDINNEITNCFSFLADPFVLFFVFPSIFQRLENSSLQVKSCLLFWDQVFQLVSKKDKKHKNCKNHTLQSQNK